MFRKETNPRWARTVKQGDSKLYFCGEVPGPLKSSLPPSAVLFSERVLTLSIFTFFVVVLNDCQTGLMGGGRPE